MKKTLICMVISILLLLMLTSGALAVTAGFTGKIWTGKPGLLGIGYYCTAAQNTSSNSTNPFAYAKSCNSSGGILAQDSVNSNGQAIANSGSTKPYSGFGEYGEVGGYSSANFKASAYD
jgi:hypothetical protein